MVKGNQRSETGNTTPKNVAPKYVGFTKVQIRAVNPTRAQLNKMLGENKEEPIDYMSEDREGNTRVRLSFWMYDDKLEKYFVHSFSVVQKERVSNDGNKFQWINNVATTSWSDKEENLMNWFTTFTNKEGKVLGKKHWRKAYIGEEELATLLRTWLGQLNFNSPDAEVFIDMTAIFDGDFSELQNLVDSGYDKPFVILTGVETDENDSNKQYQKVWHKGFLPATFMEHIGTDFKKASAWMQKTYNKFEDDVTGQYGFTAYYTLDPIQEYDRAKDVAASQETFNAGITATNSRY